MSNIINLKIRLQTHEYKKENCNKKQKENIDFLYN